MGLLFLIAGYFVPISYDRKGPGRFIADRAVRLGVPTLIYALLIHPSILCVLHGVETGRVAMSLRDYAHYLLTLEFLGGTGPMWFALALLFFSIIYALGRMMGVKGRGASDRLPSNLDVLILIAAMAVGSFAVRLVQPIGTSVMNMQLCFFTQYILLFAVGCTARRRDWLNGIPLRFGMRWGLIAVLLGVPMWFAMILLGGAAKGDFNPYAGRLYWQSAVYCTWESLFCVGTCLGLLTWFRERFNRQGALARFLSDNAFAVYVFHAPILVGLALAMQGWHGPPFAKFLALTAAGLVASFLAAHLVVRRIPGLIKAMS
jgi:hypothetical protein